MSTPSDDVWLDEHGVWRVAKSSVMLDSVVAAYQQGHSAETIQQQYPSLSLADVYYAIAHYLRHRDDVDQYLKHQDTVWQASRNEWNARSGALAQRLRDARDGVPLALNQAYFLASNWRKA